MNNCIYFIRNILNNKIYIGSTINSKKRFNEHRRKLRKNIHHSDYLQRAWNKYGEENFIFEIKEYCELEKLRELELKYFSSRNPDYNVSKHSVAPMTGLHHSRETKLLLSKRHKNNKYNLGKKHSEECKKARSEKRKLFRWNNEVKLKMSETARRINSISRVDRTKSYKKVIDSNGNIFETCIACSKFWRISVQTVCDILKGRHNKTRKGISFKYV